MFDLLIKNGTVIDGTGSPGQSADVAIKDGLIVEVGKVSGDANETIDATGRIVCPGFIDVHTHYDAQVLWDPALTPSCLHGVTTVFGGHCGFSIAPLVPESVNYIRSMLARVEGMSLESLEAGTAWDWMSFGDYLQKLEGQIGLNAGFMAGHSPIRRLVMGERAVGEEASAAEIERMQDVLASALEDGAIGFSSTLSVTHNDADGNPVPSRFATRDELVALASTCGQFPGTGLECLPGIGGFSDEHRDLLTEMSVVAQRPLNWNVIPV